MTEDITARPAEPSGARSRAFVESPLQLLGALEATAAGLLGTQADILYRTGSRQLASLVGQLDSRKLPAGASVRPSARAVAPVRGTWAVGDIFSGQVERALTLAPVQRLVLLDDGIATLRALDLLLAGPGYAMIRSRGMTSPARRRLGRITHERLRALARAGRLTVATAMPVAPAIATAFEALGGRLARHSFAWSASLPIGAEELHDDVVVGSALVADGLVRAECYLEWVESTAAAAPGRLTYLPHRRESADVLRHISLLAEVDVVRSPWPVEALLTRLPAGARVHCLPSTPLLTLGMLLPPRGIRLTGAAIPDDWWLPGSEVFRDGLMRTTSRYVTP